MDDTFGKYSEYMALGYAAAALILGGMVVWMYLRYVALRREAAQIDQLEEEIREDRVAQTVGAQEHQAQPEAATEEVSGMAAPGSDRSRAFPAD